MATVVASEAASRAGMKNRPGERCTERRNRAAREVLNPATGTARAGDLPSAGLVMRQSGEPRRAHAHSATAWLHRLRRLASRPPPGRQTGRLPGLKPARSREVPK